MTYHACFLVSLDARKFSLFLHRSLLNTRKGEKRPHNGICENSKGYFWSYSLHVWINLNSKINSSYDMAGKL